MNTSAAANYVIRIDGHLGEHCSASLVGTSIIRNSDGTTTIAGPVADQDQLHQVIARICSPSRPSIVPHAVGS